MYTVTTTLALDKLAIAASIATIVTRLKFIIEVFGNAKAGSVTALDSTSGKTKAAVTIQVTKKAEKMPSTWLTVLFLTKRASDIHTATKRAAGDKKHIKNVRISKK